jgi:hypothetical protein
MLNFVLERISEWKPNVPQANPNAIAAHQRVLSHAFAKYLYDFEIDEITNGYTRYEVTEELVLQDFFNGDIAKHEVPKDDSYKFALEYTRKQFAPPQRCRPVHIFDVQHHYPMKNRPNAEPPFSTEKRFLSMIPPNTKPSTGNMKPIIFNYVRQWHHEIKEDRQPDHNYFFFMILHLKTALVASSEPPKVRSIFGVPKIHIIAQIMFLWPLFAHYKRNSGSTPLLWGYETFNGGWMRLNHKFFCTNMQSSFLMIDWKRFDKYSQFSVIQDLFTIIRSYLDFDNGYVPTQDYPDTQTDWTPTKSHRLENLWNWTIKAFFGMPVVLPDGRVYTRKHAGIPSGLYATQYLDSLYNSVMLVTILHSLGIVFTKEFLQMLMGDDSITKLGLLIPKEEHQLFLASMQEKADYYFASIISMAKSKVSNTLNGTEVLSYTNHNGLPRRELIPLLAQFYHTRARNPTPAKTMASAIGFAYASCGFSDRVLYVCKDIYNFYLNQGYTPDPSGIPLALGDDPFGLTLSDISLDHFPETSEIQAKLTCLDYVAPSVSHFFPMTHFLEPY